MSDAKLYLVAVYRTIDGEYCAEIAGKRTVEQLCVPRRDGEERRGIFESRARNETVALRCAVSACRKRDARAAIGWRR